jgi:hypothetical protein
MVVNDELRANLRRPRPVENAGELLERIGKLAAVSANIVNVVGGVPLLGLMYI